MNMQINIPFTAPGEAVRVVELLVAPGDTVAVGEPLLAVESDKAIFDVPSVRQGAIRTLHCAVGDHVSSGQPLVTFDDEPLAPAAVPIPADGTLVEVKTPFIAAQDTATLTEMLVAPGQYVGRLEVIASVQTSKAVIDIPSPVSGVIESTGRMVGEMISATDVVAVIRAAQSGLPPWAAAASCDRAEAPPGGGIAASAAPAPALRPQAEHLTPSQRRQARLSGAPAAVAAQLPQSSADGLTVAPWPKIDFGKFGPVQVAPLSRIQKISGANLHRNWVCIPHVTHNEDADITDLEVLRLQLNREHEKAGIKFTMLAFAIKAVVCALRKFPAFNASLDGDKLVYKQYFHVGFAADTPNGLVVPVIRDCDRKGLAELAREMAELSQAARAGKLQPAQMQGGCFSISSLGGIGGTGFTPIINAPEVAILGLSRGAHKPVWDGQQFVPRLMLPMSLSYDHRVIDGAEAARFSVYLASLLADFRRALL